MNWALYGIAGFLVASVLSYMTQFGKPRRPIGSGDVIYVTVAYAVIVTVIVLAARRLT